MNGPSKEEIKRAVEFDESYGYYYEPWERAAIIEKAYREAVECLREVSWSGREVCQEYDERLDYVEMQIDKSVLKDIENIINKYPEEVKDE